MKLLQKNKVLLFLNEKKIIFSNFKKDMKIGKEMMK